MLAGGRLIFEQAQTSRGLDRCGASWRLQLPEDRRDVVGDRTLRELQRRRDLGVGRPGCELGEHVLLAAGQAVVLASVVARGPRGALKPSRVRSRTKARAAASAPSRRSAATAARAEDWPLEAQPTRPHTAPRVLASAPPLPANWVRICPGRARSTSRRPLPGPAGRRRLVRERIEVSAQPRCLGPPDAQHSMTPTVRDARAIRRSQ